jgi:hypothetical protein
MNDKIETVELCYIIANGIYIPQSKHKSKYQDLMDYPYAYYIPLAEAQWQRQRPTATALYTYTKMDDANDVPLTGPMEIGCWYCVLGDNKRIPPNSVTNAVDCYGIP